MSLSSNFPLAVKTKCICLKPKTKSRKVKAIKNADADAIICVTANEPQCNVM